MINVKVYEKPVVSVDTGMAEGVYAASGATNSGSVTASGLTVTADWGGRGQASFTLNFDNVSQNNIKVVVTFSSNIANAWGGGASATCSGDTANLSWYAAPTSAEIAVQADNINQLKIVSCSIVNN